MIRPERDHDKALQEERRLPRTLLPNHRPRIRDARPRRVAAVIR